MATKKKKVQQIALALQLSRNYSSVDFDFTQTGKVCSCKFVNSQSK